MELLHPHSYKHDDQNYSGLDFFNWNGYPWTYSSILFLLIFQVSKYDLELIPDLVDNFTTAGKVDIHIKTLSNVWDSEPTKLSFHSHQIRILEDTVTVTKANDPSIVLNVVGYEYDIDRLFYVIHLAQVIYTFFLSLLSTKVHW